MISTKVSTSPKTQRRHGIQFRNTGWIFRVIFSRLHGDLCDEEGKAFPPRLYRQYSAKYKYNRLRVSNTRFTHHQAVTLVHRDNLIGTTTAHARNMGRENCVVLALVGVFLELGTLVSGAIIYPSVQWSFQNPR